MCYETLSFFWDDFLFYFCLQRRRIENWLTIINVLHVKKMFPLEGCNKAQFFNNDRDLTVHVALRA